MRLSISRLIGQVVGWLIILFIICSTTWDSFFGIFILFKKSFPNLKKYLDVILRRSA